jgi:hypothetical protein
VFASKSQLLFGNGDGALIFSTGLVANNQISGLAFLNASTKSSIAALNLNFSS